MYLRLSAALLCLSAFCCADTLTLKNGGVIRGTYLGGDARQVKMAVGDHVDSYAVDEIARVEFGDGANDTLRSRDTRSLDAQAPGGLARRDTLQDQRRPVDPRRDNNDPGPPRPFDRGDARPDVASDRSTPGDSSMEVPAGTSLVVRLIDGVDSQTDRLGQTYRASIDEPVIVNGQTVIPRGADVTAKLVNDQQSGKIQGRTVLTLDLVQVQINGRMVDVNTADVSHSSGSRSTRSAKVIGGTTALGAIIGAIAGGGRGAAIGATSGAAVGTGAQVVTKGEQVKIPPETRLSFTLEQPLRP